MGCKLAKYFMYEPLLSPMQRRRGKWLLQLPTFVDLWCDWLAKSFKIHRTWRSSGTPIPTGNAPEGGTASDGAGGGGSAAAEACGYRRAKANEGAAATW